MIPGAPKGVHPCICGMSGDFNWNLSDYLIWLPLRTKVVPQWICAICQMMIYIHFPFCCVPDGLIPGRDDILIW